MPKFVLLAILLPGVFAHAETLTPGSLEAKLYHELLAPCCYRETLDHHTSDISIALKTEIHGLVAGGKSESQILELYKSRYGARILAQPEGALWWVETLMPVFALAIGVMVVVHIIRKWTSATVVSQIG